MPGNSAVVGILRALLTLNNAQFESGMKKSADSMKAFSRDARNVGRQATEVGATLTKTLTLPIVGFGVVVSKLAMDFESSFAGIRKTVNATETQFAGLASGLRALSKTIPINVNELNRIGEAAGQLGIKTENIVGFTEVMAKLGVTTNLSSDQAATSLARLANITGMSQGDFDRLGSSIVALGNNFATTEAEIVDFGLRIAGAGAMAKMSEADILGIGAALSSVGVGAEAGGTAVQRVIQEMVAATVQGGKSLEIFAKTAFGPSGTAAQFKRAFQEDAAEAFTAFVEGLGRQGQNAIAVLDGLGLADARLIRSFVALAGAGNLTREAISLSNAEWSRNTALTIEAERRFATTFSQFTLLWNRIKDVGITIGNALLPTIRSMIAAFDSLVPILERASNLFIGLPTPVQATAVAIAGMTAAMGPAIFLFGQLALSAAALAGAFTRKGLATVALTGAVAGLRVQLPTLTAAIASLAGVFALSGTQVTALGLTLSGVGAIAATVASVFVGWKFGRWIGEVTGATDTVERFAGWLMRLPKAHVEAAMAARKHAEATKEAARVFEALAAHDMAQWANALEETRKRAQELKGDLPDFITKVQQLSAIVVDFAAKGQLTPSVMREMANQASVLKAQVGQLPPELEALVTWLERQNTELRETPEATDPAIAGLKKLTDEERKAAEAAEFMAQQYRELMALLASPVALPGALAMENALGPFALPWMLNPGAGLSQIVPSGPLPEWMRRENMGVSAPPPGGPFNFSRFLQGNLGPTILSSLTGGGNLGKSIGGLFGGGGMQKLLETGIGKSISGALGGVLGSVLPGIGNILGSLAGGLFGKLFGPSDADKTRSARNQWIESVGGMNKLKAAAERAGISLSRVFNARKPKEFEAAVKAVTAQIEAHEQKQARLNDVIERYGITVEQMGPKFRNQRLGEMAQAIVEDYRDLLEITENIALANEKIAPKVQEYLRLAKITGAEVPSAMKPIIQSLIDQGLLLDENGNAITDITQLGITWAATMTEGFNAVIDAIKDLQAAITGIPRDINIHVGYTADPFPNQGGGGDGGQVLHTGGIVRALRRFDRGGIIDDRRAGRMGGNVPILALVGESVLNRQATATLGESGVNALNSGAFMDPLASMPDTPSMSMAVAGAVAGEIRGLRVQGAQDARLSADQVRLLSSIDNKLQCMLNEQPDVIRDAVLIGGR